MQTGLIISEIFFLGILVFVGVVGSAFGVLNKSAKDLLAKIVFNITLPLLLLTTFSRMDVTPKILANSLSIIWLSLIVMALMLLVGWLWTKLLRLKVREAAIFKTHSMFGNIIFLGYPVIYALYGEEGLIYAGMLQLVSNLLLWTVGVVMLGTGNGKSVKNSMLKVFNINTYAIAIGFIMFITGIKLPSFLMEPLNGLGGTNIYLSMIYMGVMMFHSGIRGMFGRPVVWYLSLNKLMVFPLILIGIFYLLHTFTGFNPDRLVVSVLIMQSSMPCMANIIILARVYGADDELATANVFMSTLMSLGTLPLILYILGVVLSF